MSTKVITGEGRFSYAHVAVPQEPSEPGGKLKYSITFLVPKSDTDTINRLRAAEEAAKKEGVAKKWGGSMPRKVFSVLKDGDNDDDFQGAKGPGDEVRGHWVFSARSDSQPAVVDHRVNRIDPEQVYSGAYGRLSITAFPYEYKGKAGVSFALNSIQFIRDGERLSGGGQENPENVFDVVEVSDDEAYGDISDLL